MAYTATIKGQHVLIQMGDGATPTEVFATICGITTKGLELTTATTDTVVWDCADEDAPPKTVRDIGARDWQISGNGQADSAAVPSLYAAWKAGLAKNFRFVFKDPVIDKYAQGSGIISSLTIGADNGSKATVSITIVAADDLSALTANP